jgi:hypothetical protein
MADERWAWRAGCVPVGRPVPNLPPRATPLRLAPETQRSRVPSKVWIRHRSVRSCAIRTTGRRTIVGERSKVLDRPPPASPPVAREDNPTSGRARRMAIGDEPSWGRGRPLTRFEQPLPPASQILAARRGGSGVMAGLGAVSLIFAWLRAGSESLPVLTLFTGLAAAFIRAGPDVFWWTARRDRRGLPPGSCTSSSEVGTASPRAQGGQSAAEICYK